MPSSALALRLGRRSVTAAIFAADAVMLAPTLARRVYGGRRTDAPLDARAAQDAVERCIDDALGAAQAPAGSIGAVGVCLHRPRQTDGADTEVYHAPLEALARTLPAMARDRWQELAAAVWAPPASSCAAATVGAGCIDATRMSLNLGADSFATVLAPDDAAVDLEGLWREPIVGGLAVYGAGPAPGVEWVDRSLETVDLPADAEEALAARTPDCHGLMLFPPTHAGAPGSGSVAGLQPDTSALDFLQAAMETVAMNLAGLRERLRSAFPCAGEAVASGSGIHQSMLWANMLADALGTPISLAEEPSAAERGAAILAMVAAEMLPAVGAAPAPLGPLVRHDPSLHAIFVRAIERRTALLTRMRSAASVADRPV